MKRALLLDLFLNVKYFIFDFGFLVNFCPQLAAANTMVFVLFLCIFNETI